MNRTSNRPTKDVVRALIGAFNYVSHIAYAVTLDLDKKIVALNRPGDQPRKREKRKVVMHTPIERRNLFLELFRILDQYTGVSLTWENYRERLFVHVTLLKLLNPQRWPFFEKSLVDRVFIGHAVNFPGFIPNPLIDKTAIVNILLPHTARVGHKGYSFLLVPPCLLPEFSVLLEPKVSMWRRTGGGAPYTFGAFMHGRDLPRLNAPTTSGAFPVADYTGWLKGLQELLGFKNIVTGHIFKKHFFSDGLNRALDRQTEGRMLAINNEDQDVVERHYQYAAINGYLIDPRALRVQLDMVQEFEDAFNQHRMTHSEEIGKSATHRLVQYA